jgi:hypothetical protein
MNSYLYLFLTICSLVSLNVCKTSSEASAVANADRSQDLLFIGCVPTVGECRYSCPERDGHGQMDRSICPDDLSPIACSCPSENFVAPKPPDPTIYDFVGCVPTGSECRYSCNSRNIIAFQGSEQCDLRQFACYCKK